MFYTKKWGVVSCRAELMMLAKAEHSFEKKRKKGQHDKRKPFRKLSTSDDGDY